MPSGNITERSDITDLNQNSTVRIPTEGHSCLKQHVWSRLAGKFALVDGISFCQKCFLQPRLVVGCKKHYDCGCLGKGGLENCSHVRSALTCFFQDFVPFNRL